jgi:hypothetical protein
LAGPRSGRRWHGNAYGSDLRRIAHCYYRATMRNISDKPAAA